MRKETNIKIHSIRFNFIMNVILKASQFVFPLITFPYVARVLGAAANGKIGFALSVVSYFSLIASLGIPSYGVRKCAEVRNDKYLLSKTVKELLCINSICLIITYALFLISILCVPRLRGEKALMLITSMSIIFNVLGVDWFYQSIEQYSYITIRNISFKIIGLVLMFVFVHNTSDYLIYAGITVFASVGSNILNIIRLHSLVDLKTPQISIEDLLVHLSPILLLFLYNATTTIFTNLDQVMLGFMKTDEIVGHYSAAIKVKNILTSFITALGAVMLPRISFYLKQGSTKEFNELIKKSFNFIVVSAIPLMLFFTLKSYETIVFIAGKQYEASSLIMKGLMPSLFFIGLSSVTAWQLLIPLGKEKITVYGAVCGALVDLVINFSLIPRYGAFGAAIGTSAAELVVLFVHWLALREIISENFDKKELTKALLSVFFASVILIITNKTLQYRNLFIDCVISTIVFFGMYFTSLFVLKEKLVYEYIVSFFLKRKRG